ncbi:unnamed protein product [Discula destructiva]
MASLPTFRSFDGAAVGARVGVGLETSNANKDDGNQSATDQAAAAVHNKALMMVDEEAESGGSQATQANVHDHEDITTPNQLADSAEHDRVAEHPTAINMDSSEDEAVKQSQTAVEPSQTEANNGLHSISAQSTQPSHVSQTNVNIIVDGVIRAEALTCLHPTTIKHLQELLSSQTKVNDTTDGTTEAGVNDSLSSTAVESAQISEVISNDISQRGGAGETSDLVTGQPLHEALSRQNPDLVRNIHILVNHIYQKYETELQAAGIESEVESESDSESESGLSELSSVTISLKDANNPKGKISQKDTINHEGKINHKDTIMFIMLRSAKAGLLTLGAAALYLKVVLNDEVTSTGSIPRGMPSTVLRVALLVAGRLVSAMVVCVSVSAALLLIENMRTKINHDALTGPSKLPAPYYFYVLGSGGHTTEMMALIKLTHKPTENTHRRYLVTTGDQHSVNQSEILEQAMSEHCPDGQAGTFDLFKVMRARAVHQSFASSIASSLSSALDIVSAILTIPLNRAADARAKLYRYPDVIVTNGPGTGFVVALVVFILKVFFLVPRNRLQVVFVETWARGHSLGLTGKLFYWTMIASLFLVQSEELAKTMKVPSIGNVNQKWADYCQSATAEQIPAKKGAAKKRAAKKRAAKKAAAEKAAEKQGAE